MGCSNTGNITCSSNSSSCAGGIAGLLTKKIIGCYSKATSIVGGTKSNKGTIVGSISNDATMTDCYSQAITSLSLSGNPKSMGTGSNGGNVYFDGTLPPAFIENMNSAWLVANPSATYKFNNEGRIVLR